jgi:signal transduction histidine kinase
MEAMEGIEDRPRKLRVCSTLQGPGTILVEIRDYGVGLADSNRVFEAFYTTKEKGMGMGLPLCRSIVEAHGGRLGMTPTEGPGVAFFFTLPLGSSHPHDP